MLDTIKSTKSNKQNTPQMVVLCGYPGSGKTLARKILAHQSGWPVFSWSRTARRILLSEFGEVSTEAVEQLTMVEMEDPEMVAREFLMREELGSLPGDTPVVIDGVKSVTALRFLERHLDRQGLVVKVYRDSAQRTKAIAERRHFDDADDSRRIELLNAVGLSELLDLSMMRINMSDSHVERRTGRIVVGDTTREAIVAVVEQIGCGAIQRRLQTASLLLFAPQNNVEFLLLKSRATGNWGLPGGSMELGERPWHAATRELLEETGITVDGCGITLQPGELRKTAVRDGNLMYEKKTHVFVARASTRDFKLSDEHVAATWVNRERGNELLSGQTRALVDNILDEFASSASAVFAST